jgi:hypothetical protein
LAAARAAFLSETEKNRLVETIIIEFDRVVSAHSSV